MWFAQKLHNKILAMQKKARRPRNTLIKLAFTTIGTYHLDHFVENPKKHVTTLRRYQSNDNKAIVDVHVVMLEPRHKKE
jgi:hypothetical protein